MYIHTHIYIVVIIIIHINSNIFDFRGQMMQNYKVDKIREQISMDIENALSSLKVVPNKCTIKPYGKVPLKIQFKPVGMISTLNVQVPEFILNNNKKSIVNNKITKIYYLFTK